MRAKRQTATPPERHRTTDKVQRVVYMDHNATTPLDPRVLNAMHAYLTDDFGNAASKTHAYGRTAEQAVERARGAVAALLNAEPKEVIWTSGATEANNLAIKGIACALRERGRHIVTQATEHNAVLDPCRWLGHEGFDVTVLPVDRAGRVSADDVANAIRSDTILVSVMYANNEIGTIQGVEGIASLCAERGIVFHTDAAQAVGKIDIDLKRCPIDLLSISAHKLYGPKGCGALYVRHQTPRLRLTPQMHGGGHERGMRSGTLNVPGIVGIGAACEICLREMPSERRRLKSLRDRLESNLCSRLKGVTINGDTVNRLPHMTSLTFAGAEAEAALVAMPDVALSTGSACTSAAVEPSHVLRAIGLPESEAHRTLRFGLGRSSTEADVTHVVERVSSTIARLRELSGFN